MTSPSPRGAWFERLVRALGGGRDRDPAAAFQRRFLVGCATAAVVTSTLTLASTLAAGQHVSAAIVGSFAAVITALALALRRGLPLPIAVLANLSALTVFLFLASLVTRELAPEQLAWLTLLPVCSALAVRPGSGPRTWIERHALPLGAGAAVAVAAGVFAARDAGLTFGQPLLREPLLMLFDFGLLVLALSYLVSLLARLLREAEAELDELRRLLSVCAWCHKIRDDAGAWVAVGKYLHDRGTPVSHGMCDACARAMEVP